MHCISKQQCEVNICASLSLNNQRDDYVRSAMLPLTGKSVWPWGSLVSWLPSYRYLNRSMLAWTRICNNHVMRCDLPFTVAVISLCLALSRRLASLAVLEDWSARCFSFSRILWWISFLCDQCWSVYWQHIKCYLRAANAFRLVQEATASLWPGECGAISNGRLPQTQRAEGLVNEFNRTNGCMFYRIWYQWM